MLVDCHCHLGFPEFDKDIDEIVKRAHDMLIINSCVDVDSFEKDLEIVKRYDNVRCCLGFSASEVSSEKFRKTYEMIKEYKDEVVGLGEVGLDYHWIKDRKAQSICERYFIAFIKLSKKLKLPLVIHSRDAESRTVELLKQYDVPAIMHCFSGTIEEAKKAIKEGCLISVPTNVTKSKMRQKLVKSIPIESIVLETDAPYMGPTPGIRNEPSNIRYALEKISDITGKTTDELEYVTSQNALKFFRI
jgi:TatD DNase family protein